MKNPRVQSPSSVLLSGSIFALTISGCSLLYDLGTQQCITTSDCRRMGQQFEHTSCVNRVCVEQSSVGGGSGAGGGGSGSTPALAGSAGSSLCRNEECLRNNVHSICRDNRCVELITPNCPVLIPKNSAATLLKLQDVIVVGGFATMDNPGNSYDSQAIVNWSMALDEFNTKTNGGLPRYGDGTLRPIVGLVCRGTQVDTPAIIDSVQHLTETVQVPAILSALSANYLYQAWANQRSDASADKRVFFMSTSSADQQLANLADNGLVWHMLGDPRSLAAPVVALLKQIERAVNERRAENYAQFGVDDPLTEPLRVTLVSSDEPILDDIANVLVSVERQDRPGTLLTFNGKPWSENGDSARWVKIQSIRQHPKDPDVSPALAELSARPPHVIVAMTTGEFPAFVIGDVERLWTDKATGTVNRVRPTYIMSHLSFNSTDLTTAVSAGMVVSPALESRLVGVNFASAQDARSKELYAAYLARLKVSYQDKLSLEGTENYYDGAYYLAYSIAAAAAVYKRPSGSNIVDGLLNRVISVSSEAVSVNVGPDPLSTTMNTLFLNAASASLSLYGTMGPPNFDRLSGTRLSPTSAWCTRMNAQGTGYEFVSDGLIFDASSRTFTRPMTGVPQCLTEYCNSETAEGGAVCR